MPRGILAVSPGLCGTAAPRDVVLDAARLYRCTLAPDQAAAQFAKVGLSPEAADVAGRALVAEGAATVDAGGFTVTPEACALKPHHPDDRTAWIAAFREGGCRVDLGSLDDIATRHSLPRDKDPALRAMLDSGEVTRLVNGLYLDPATCAPDARAAHDGAETRWLIAELAARRCTASGTDLALGADAAGLAPDAVSAALAGLVLDGSVRVESGNLVLNAGACAAATPPSLADAALDRIRGAVRDGVADAYRASGCTFDVSMRAEDRMILAVRDRLGAGPVRTAAADKLIGDAVDDVVRGPGFRRDGKVITMLDCTP